MKLSRDQRLGVEAACAGLICAIAWGALVRPKQAALSQSEATLKAQTSIEQQIASSLGTDAAAAERNRERVESRGALLDAALAFDGGVESHLEAFERLANAHSVQIISVDPRSKGAYGRGASELIESNGYNLKLLATYAQVAAFIDAVENDIPLTMVTSLRLSPDGAEDVGFIHAELSTTHITASESVVAIESEESGA